MLELPKPEEIRAYRQKLGLTQKKLAELAGVSQSMISKIEEGKIDPRLSTLRRIVEALKKFEVKELKAWDIASKPVIRLSPGETLRKAIDLMIENDYSQIPIFSGNKPVGVVTESLAFKLVVENPDALNFRVAEIMESCPPVVDWDVSLETVKRLLKDSQAILVRKGREWGIITKADILAHIR